jgi:single-stranded-DNA-specific exonuclease
MEALKACAEHLQRFGGHEHAAGLSVEPDRIAAFAEAFERIAAERLTEEDLIPTFRVDALVRTDELDDRAVEAVEALGPFGMGNPQPVFAAQHAIVQPRVLPSKREGAPAHLKLRLEDAPHLDAIAFSMGDRVALTQGPVDLAFQLGFDEWHGVRRLSLKVKDLRAAA